MHIVGMELLLVKCVCFLMHMVAGHDRLVRVEDCRDGGVIHINEVIVCSGIGTECANDVDSEACQLTSTFDNNSTFQNAVISHSTTW